MKQEIKDYLLSHVNKAPITLLLGSPDMVDDCINYVLRNFRQLPSNVTKQKLLQDLNIFFYRCQRANLNPLMGHIICKYDGNGDFYHMTTIYGARWIAEQSGHYIGSTDVKIDGNEAEKDPNNILSASIEVARTYDEKNCYYETKATAYFKSYAPRDIEGNLVGMWATHPEFMIGKVAEALALRKAFPSELGQLYVQEELDTLFTRQNNQEQNKNKLTQEVKDEIRNNYQIKVKQARADGGEDTSEH